MSLRLVVVDPARGGALLAEGAFDGPEVTFGRRPGDNLLVIPDPAKRVSSKHGAFVHRDGAWFVRDLGSLNGTQLDGETVPVDDLGLKVSHGDIITIGGLEMQVLEDASQLTPTPDFAPDQTVAAHAEGREEQLVAELEAIWLKFAHSAKERGKALEQHLRRGVADVMPDKAVKMLHGMAERWGAVGVSASPEVEAREKLFRVAFDGLNDLSKSFVADDRFQEAEQIGRFVMLLRQAVELTGDWLARNLTARDSFCEQFQANVTQVMQRARNPIKQSAHGPEVTRMILDWREAKPPASVADHMRQLFEDLSRHQMGMLQSVESVVDALVARVSPAKVEQELESAGLSLSSRGSRAWDAYTKLYEDLFLERSRLFEEVVSPAIRDGYLRAQEGPPPAH